MRMRVRMLLRSDERTLMNQCDGIDLRSTSWCKVCRMLADVATGRPLNTPDYPAMESRAHSRIEDSHLNH
jgi:hypothetical protein